jgi:four helix bundle protein
MGRFRPATIDRTDDFSHRIVDVAEAVEKKGRSRRVVDQMFGCGTSVGANIAEADEALSRKDFSKTLGIVLKELNECRYWLRFVTRRGWIRPQRLEPLQNEALELKRMFGAMLTRTNRK